MAATEVSIILLAVCGLALVVGLAAAVVVVILVRGRGSPAGTRACPACGVTNPADHAYCDRCGAKLYEEIV